MTILADECMYQITVDVLRKRGFTVITAQEIGLAGCQNGDVLAYARRNQAVFLTRDKDFTDIRIYPPADYNGIIVLKITPSNQADVHNILFQLLREKPLSELSAKLVIVDRKKYRIVGE